MCRHVAMLMGYRSTKQVATRRAFITYDTLAACIKLDLYHKLTNVLSGLDITPMMAPACCNCSRTEVCNSIWQALHIYSIHITEAIHLLMTTQLNHLTGSRARVTAQAL